MRGRAQCASTAEAARALHRLAFALWRAVFYLQRGQIRAVRMRSRNLDTGQRKLISVCLCSYY